MSAFVGGQGTNDGVIFDATHNDIQEELRTEIGKRRLETILDTKMMDWQRLEALPVSGRVIET